MNPSGQQNPGGDQASNFFWMIVLIFGAVLLVWFFDQQYVVIPCFWLRTYELDFMHLLATLWLPVAQFLHLPKPNLAEIAQLQIFLKHTDPTSITWQNFAAINTAIGRWTRFPVVFILAGLSVFLFFFGGGQFHHVYNMTVLRQVGQEVWPQITPVVSLDLIKENIDKGPWAMAQVPLEFCRQHDLLSSKTVAQKKVWVLKQKPSYRLFALQLGPVWKGLDALPIHAKALAFVFLARATGQRKEANAILTQIATSASGGKLDFTGVEEKLQEFREHRIIKWLEKRHAYVTTIMATMLEIARSDGVLASAEFLWLKPTDRRLWFVLNTVGRRSSVVEVSGFYSHWKAEKKVGRALKTPMMKGAVDALDETLQNILLVEEGEQWRTGNAD